MCDGVTVDVQLLTNRSERVEHCRKRWRVLERVHSCRSGRFDDVDLRVLERLPNLLIRGRFGNVERNVGVAEFRLVEINGQGVSAAEARLEVLARAEGDSLSVLQNRDARFERRQLQVGTQSPLETA